MSALLLSVREAAREAGIGRDSMYALVATGRVRSVPIGRRRLIPRQELERWIERELEGGGDDHVGNGAGSGFSPSTDTASRG